MEKLNGWIMCEDRLPEENAELLGSSDDVLVLMERFDGEKTYYDIFTGYLEDKKYGIWHTYMHNSCAQVGLDVFGKHQVFRPERIVAWRPLPELPDFAKEKA